MSNAYRGDVEDWDEHIVAILQAFTPELWAATVVFFVGGDLLTTAFGLLNGGVAEVGPVVAPILQAYGLFVMIPLKLLAIAVCFALWRLAPQPHAVGVPLGLAVFGVLVTGWNIGVLIVSMLLV